MTENSIFSRREVALGAAFWGIAAAVPAQTNNADSVGAIKALLESYQKAFAAHDMAGVVNLFAPNAIVIGTGPGEIWGGAAEIRTAYQRFFDLFDKGQQTHEILFTDGHALSDMAWMVNMLKVSFSKGTNKTEFGLNLSAVFEKSGGRWLIRTMHFSNLTSGAPKKL